MPCKEPENRYASCQDLAEDLGRWLRDEPIIARPVTRVERGWRWCRRNPVVAGLSLTAAVLLVAAGVGYLSTTRARHGESTAKAASESDRKDKEAAVVRENAAQQLAEAEQRKAEEEEKRAEAERQRLRRSNGARKNSGRPAGIST